MRLADLPVPPQQMNTLSVILSYSLQGVSDHDIANVLTISSEALGNIKSGDAYRDLQDTIVSKIVESDATDVRNMFVASSSTAANVMVDVMNDDENGPVTRMAAAKDVLDRAGHRPIDIVEHRHKMEGGLTIEYVDKKDDIPIIDITPDEF
jgi:hypothetical protein